MPSWSLSRFVQILPFLHLMNMIILYCNDFINCLRPLICYGYTNVAFERLYICDILYLSQTICRFRFPRNNFDKIYIKNINIYDT
jgi:hypothetical protein